MPQTQRFVRRLLQRNQVTLPSVVVRTLNLNEGDYVEVSIDQNGLIQLRPTLLVTAGTRAAKREDARAEADIARGRFTTFDDAASAVRHLKGYKTTATQKTRSVPFSTKRRSAAGRRKRSSSS